MVFPVVGGNQSTGDFITNSLRFNDGDNPLLTRTHSDTNHRTFTFSCWVYFSRRTSGNRNYIYVNGFDTNNMFWISKETSDKIRVGAYGTSGFLVAETSIPFTGMKCI